MPKRKTNDEFVKELKEKLPNIIPLEVYSNNHTKIKCKCLIHDEFCFTTPHLLLKGHNCCKRCISEEKSKRLLMSNEQFLQQLIKKNINVRVITIEVKDNQKSEKQEPTIDLFAPVPTFTPIN